MLSRTEAPNAHAHQEIPPDSGCFAPLQSQGHFSRSSLLPVPQPPKPVGPFVVNVHGCFVPDFAVFAPAHLLERGALWAREIAAMVGAATPRDESPLFADGHKNLARLDREVQALV